MCFTNLSLFKIMAENAFPGWGSGNAVPVGKLSLLTASLRPGQAPRLLEKPLSRSSLPTLQVWQFGSWWHLGPSHTMGSLPVKSPLFWRRASVCPSLPSVPLMCTWSWSNVSSHLGLWVLNLSQISSTTAFIMSHLYTLCSWRSHRNRVMWKEWWHQSVFPSLEL